ncbi:MAG: acetyl-CoA carboxylase biotin carboxyl carrier protein [Candidatus Omnitrophica bacterium]|nr:acetyl-CoA carboxylase biotin carboxyl carrier protein [Candidatus Omnitrophota bacterium]
MNIKEIKEMINLMNENSLMELEVEKEGMRIRLKKSSISQEAGSGPIIVEQQNLKNEQFQGGGRNQAQPAPAAPEAKPNASKTVEIKAPMVGTFYRAPSPESPAFVEVCQVIQPGQVICIIEAMKLMNEIKAEIKGKLLEVLVDNAEPVEFGQPMFLIEPL